MAFLTGLLWCGACGDALDVGLKLRVQTSVRCGKTDRRVCVCVCVCVPVSPLVRVLCFALCALQRCAPAAQANGSQTQREGACKGEDRREDWGSGS